MEKFIITTGKTVELAEEAALKELNLDRDSVSVEILDMPKNGFLGIGAQPARIKVTYEGPAEDYAPALSSASRSKPKKPTAPKADVKPAPAKEVKPAPKAEAKPAPKAEAKPAPKKDYAPAAAGSVEEQVEVFLKGLLEHMGSTAVPHAWKDEENIYRVDLVGENLGALIGRRGDTLDAIQHLTNYAINHGGGKRLRINVDAENYRAKREEALQQLARKVAGKVKKYRRNITLEPMNAYERHIIHAALQEEAEITTFSTGTEPNRRIVVAYSQYKTAFTED
ncbi:MAG: Jag N-terminal domain-containing protein [Oscillospiraceae bacterium]|nr:Jag N-terminal domain-containing protein [Oscillospiraceae bacterium]